MRWKWFVTAGVLIIVVLITAAYVYLKTYDYNKLKPLVGRVVQDATGRKLSLGGDVNFKFGFAPELVVTDVALANVSWGSQPQMVEIEKLQAKVRLLPLLFKELDIKYIRLVGVKVLLETGPNSQGNWDFPAGSNSAGSVGVFKPTAVEINQVSIENLNLTFRPNRTRPPTQFTLASLEMNRQENEDALAFKLRADYNGQPLTLSGKTGRLRDVFTHRRFPVQLAGKLANASVTINGAIEDVLTLRGIDVKARLSGNNFMSLGPVPDIQLPATKSFDVSTHFTGSGDSLKLENIKGNLSGNSVNINVSGSVGNLITFSGVDLQLKSSGKDLAVMGPLIGEKLPATDSFEIQGHLTGSTEALTMTDTRAAASRSSLRLTVNGAVKDMITLKGLDLQSRLTGTNLVEFGEIIGEKLPATDKFEIKGRLTGSTNVLALQKAQGSATRGSMRLSLTGTVKNLLTLKGMDLQSRLAGKNLVDFGGIIGEKLPATDKFEIQGRLIGSAEALTLQKVQSSATRGSMRLTVDGAVKDLLAFRNMALESRLSGKDLTEFGEIIGVKLPATDKFEIQGRLTGSTAALSLQKARGSTRRGSIELTVSGGIKNLLALGGINVKLKASGKEFAEIGPLIGAKLPDLGSFDVSGRLAGSAKTILLKEFSVMLDKSDLKGLAKVEILKRPKLTIRLQSSVIDFTALMKSLEQDEQKTAHKTQQKRRLFSDDPLPFDVLKKVDADIVLKAKKIHAKDAHFKFGHMTLKLKDSDFSIDKLEATYKETKISGSLQINAGAPSQVAANFLVQNFNLGDFLKDTGKSDQVRAIVDIAAHGKSKGDSVHSLMANLDGAIGAVMGEGYLTKYLDMLSKGLSAKVIPFWRPPKTADQIKCAVVQFDIKQGIATSKAFVFDTRAGILIGKGDINLDTEQINFLLIPKPDHHDLSFSTKLRVRGTIMDSRVGPEKLALIEEGASALSALVVGPLGLLAPFVHLGAHNAHPCNIESIGQLGLESPDTK